jgi:hypothetical protein
MIEDYLVIETTNFGMLPIDEYHVVDDSFGITHIEKISISFGIRQVSTE